MTSQENQAAYARRMHHVLEYIDRHLDQTLELSTLAEVAHFSAFHFHRLFSAWMGETFGDYLRRRRLETAAMRLIAQPGVLVLEIALSVGFGSAEAFARAFKARFGCTATEWRRGQADRWAFQLEENRSGTSAQNSNPGQLHGKQDQASKPRPGHHGNSQTATMEIPMKVKIIERQAAKIAYLRYTGAYGHPISQFWDKTVCPWMETNNLFGRPRYGISHDAPAITSADKCRYDAGVEVPADFAVSGKAFTTTIPGGSYAVTRYIGDGRDIGETWTGLLRDWLPASGMQLDARPCFEYYPTDATYDPQSGAFECDICIPVVPL
ncbi:AraC family transcriptional regulator [Collimonas silvisoli]|uniref:AraC family transcriptional regulator n=1 Tax=Collimonas silvisoli TaxID=2825884 RepID=UPI001B8B4DDC|nr:AraC family transcriptional regulator [Collimonas silvisoli]